MQIELKAKINTWQRWGSWWFYLLVKTKLGHSKTNLHTKGWLISQRKWIYKRAPFRYVYLHFQWRIIPM